MESFVCLDIYIYSDQSKSFNGIVIPDQFYKVIYDQIKGCIAFLVYQDSIGDIKEYVTTVDQIELLTGIDFFYRLSDAVENNIESKLKLNLWDF